ncbi:MAG: outer membrane beta-barrel protein [Fibrobacterota bacterium]
MRSRTCVLVALAVLFISLPALSKVWLGVEGGASKTVGDDYDQFDWGWAIAADAWVENNDYFWLGGRIAYNRWSPDEETFEELLDTLTAGDVSGVASVFSIVPMIRLTTAMENSINIFAQAGPGLYIVNDRIEVDVEDETVGGVVETEIFGDDQKVRFGLVTGGGLALNLADFFAIEALPLVNVYFDDDETITYLTLNVGVSLGIF